MNVAMRWGCPGSMLVVCLLAGLSACSSSPTKACFGTCTAPAEHLYATGLNSVLSYTLSGTGVPTSSASLAGPNTSEGIVVDPSGKFLYVADTGNGNVDAFTIGSSGALTAVSGSPYLLGSSVGGIALDPGTKFLYVTLLNTAQVAGFAINATSGALTPMAAPFPAGNTPFQAIVDPSGKFLYVSNLNDAMGGISAYTIDSTTGALTAVAGSPFPTSATTNFPGPNGLAFGASGEFLYVSMSGTVNANHVVTGFSVDAMTGVLTQLATSPFTTGKDPLRVATDPTGNFLYTANQQDSTVSAFTVDRTTGGLTEVAGSPFALASAPDGLAVDPSGGFLYVAILGANGLAGFKLDSSGALTAIAGSPFSTGSGLSGVAVTRGH